MVTGDSRVDGLVRSMGACDDEEIEAVSHQVMRPKHTHTYDAGFDSCRPPDSILRLNGEWQMSEKAYKWKADDTWTCECGQHWVTRDGWTWEEC